MVNSLYSNPFVLGKNIPEELFCDRDEETRTLAKQVLIAIASEGFATNVTSGAFIKKLHFFCIDMINIPSEIVIFARNFNTGLCK